MISTFHQRLLGGAETTLLSANFAGGRACQYAFIYPDEESEYVHSGLVVRNFGGISAQTCLHDCAADRRIRRAPLALACASVPPRRARPNTRHRSSGGIRLGLMTGFRRDKSGRLPLLYGARGCRLSTAPKAPDSCETSQASRRIASARSPAESSSIRC